MSKINKENLAIARLMLLQHTDIQIIDDAGDSTLSSYCLNAKGMPILNLESKYKNQIMQFKIEDDDLVLIIKGQVHALNAESLAAARFLRYFSQGSSADVVAEIDIEECQLNNSQGVWIIDSYQELDLKNEFAYEIEDRMSDHMNEDHVDAMRAYCNLIGIKPSSSEPSMIGVDHYGFHLKLDEKNVRFDFEQRCSDGTEVREALVAMAAAGRAAALT
ncbi:MAG: DUF2470 domain-containing protein [Pseudomonadota bacterium]